jgi:poly(A) polymerase
MFMGGYGLQTFEQLRRYGLFGPLFPQTEAILAEEEGGFPHMLLIHALENTDRRVAEGKPVTPGFLVAALLWSPMHEAAAESMANGLPELEAISLAADTVISRQIASTSIPRRFTQMARDIWQMQPRFSRREGKRPQRLLQHPKFRAGYDFLLLRAAAGEDLRECADWWTRLVESEGPVEQAPEQPRPPKRRRRGGRGRRGRRPEQS